MRAHTLILFAIHSESTKRFSNSPSHQFSLFFLDYTLYAFQIFIGVPLVTANVVARVISAGFNFFVNKKFVFASDKPFLKELGGYILLASFSLTLNTLILMGLSYGFGIGPLVGKIITEIGMFFFNWFVQKKVIFGQEKGVHYVK